MTRFRRTKDEIARGLSPEQAQAERNSFQRTLASVAMPPLTDEEAQEAYDNADPVPLKAKEIEKIVRKVTRKGNGEILLRIRPGKDVDADYFEHLRDRTIEVTQNNHFYQWLDHLLDKVYNDHGQAKLFEDVLTEGIGEVLTTRQFTKDIGGNPAG